MAPKPPPAAASGGGGGGGAPLTGEDRKEQLENDPDFKRFLTALKLKVPIQQLANNMAVTKYTLNDLALFCNYEQTEALKKVGYKG